MRIGRYSQQTTDDLENAAIDIYLAATADDKATVELTCRVCGGRGLIDDIACPACVEGKRWK